MKNIAIKIIGIYKRAAEPKPGGTAFIDADNFNGYIFHLSFLRIDSRSCSIFSLGASTILLSAINIASTGPISFNLVLEISDKTLLILFLITAFLETLDETIKANLGKSKSFFRYLANKKLPFTAFPPLKTPSKSFFFLSRFFLFRANLEISN